MKKAPDAFRTISEVSDWLDTPAHVLRFWESKFSQVKPVKRAGGRRYYRPDDMRLLGGIKKLLHTDGLTIKGVQKILREQGMKHVADLSPEVTDGPAPAKKAAPARDMDSLTDEIARQVASTAKAQEKPAVSEPLKLDANAQLTKEDSATIRAAADAPKPGMEADDDVPLFLRREDQAESPAAPAAEPAQAAEPKTDGDADVERISKLYGRLKTLRSRMQEA